MPAAQSQFPCCQEGHALGDSKDTVNLYEFIDRLGDERTGNETNLTDAGQPFYILPQALRLKNGQRYLVPGSLAEMGWALPASIGIAVAAPESWLSALSVMARFRPTFRNCRRLPITN